jgi:hypothetical protein
MSERRTLPSSSGARQWLRDHETWTLPASLFLLASFVYLYGLSWGLPNGNDTWANDAIQPGAPLSVLYRLLIAEPWNSGWFWFKYPLGHVLLLGIVYAPYLGWLLLSGAISNPTSAYPYGMADPETTLATLALLGRGLSAAMGAGSVVLVYLLLRDAFGRSAAVAGALITTFCYPFVYYAHTTNVEVPYLFWLLLALLAAVRLSDGNAQRRWWLLLGAGAAMSVSTKELGAGFFLGLPPVLVVILLLRGEPLASIVGGGLVAALATVTVLCVANLVPLNPSGFVHRIGFLTQSLPPEVALEYAPYYFPIDLGATHDLASELGQLVLALERLWTSLGAATAVLAVIGLPIAAVRRPAWTLLALAGAVTFYLFGARAMLSLSMRYVMPMTLVACCLAGVAVGAIVDARRLAPLRWASVALLALYVFAYGWDVNRMFVHDPRYAAESWLAARASEQRVVEVYQRPTYLPRPPAGVRMQEVPFDQRSVEGLRARNPDFILLSSAGLSGVTVEYKKDWKGDDYASDEWIPSQRAADGTIMNYKRRANVELLDGLRAGSLGYEKTAEFSLQPWIQRPLIQSLNPRIMIYERERADADRGAPPSGPMG